MAAESEAAEVDGDNKRSTWTRSFRYWVSTHFSRADPKSLKDVATRLQGRHVLNDGSAIMVTVEYVPATSLVAGTLIGTLSDKRPLLMEWNSHLYVVSGVIYGTIDNGEGGKVDSILKIFLLDPRFSDQRRAVIFDRETDDWAKVQGLLTLTAAPQ